MHTTVFCAIIKQECNGLFQVYDRLNPPGLTLSYETSLDLIEDFKNGNDILLKRALQNGLRLRICGDNINFWVKVRDETRGHHSHMEHYFGSIVLGYDFQFSKCQMGAPQKSLTETTPALLCLDNVEIESLIDDYVYLAQKVALEHFPCFHFLHKHIPSHLTDENTDMITKKTLVIHQAAMKKNEMHYGDTVDILRSYVASMSQAFQKSGITQKNVHIGGDYLTRVMFSGSKLLMLNEKTPDDRFEWLTPISAEFFHLAMKLLAVIFKRLYNKDSKLEPGTMTYEQLSIQRKDVGPDVKKSYNEDKDFTVNYVNAHVIELIQHYFDIDDKDGLPRSKVIPEDPSKQYEWACDEFRAMITSSVGTFIYSKEDSGRTF
jgi:hypothetical protein